MKTGVFVFKHVDADAAEGSAAGYSPEEGCTDCSGLFGILAPIRPLFSLSRKKRKTSRFGEVFRTGRRRVPGLFDVDRVADQIKAPARNVVERAQILGRRLELPVAVLEDAGIGPGGDGFAHEEVVGLFNVGFRNQMT